MIRERRSRQKLETYYKRFTEKGEMDPNVHPWVAKSWSQSASLGVDYEKMSTTNRLTPEEFAELQKQHKPAIDYLENISVNVREFFQKYNISLLLLDANCTVLKSYSMPFYQMTPGEMVPPASALPWSISRLSGCLDQKCGLRSARKAMLVQRRLLWIMKLHIL